MSDIDKPVSLAALAKENERLRAENERWRDRVKSLPDHSDCRAEVKQLEQDYFDKCFELGKAMNENERLRAALREVSINADAGGPLSLVGDIARQALGETT